MGLKCRGGVLSGQDTGHPRQKIEIIEERSLVKKMKMFKHRSFNIIGNRTLKGTATGSRRLQPALSCKLLVIIFVLSFCSQSAVGQEKAKKGMGLSVEPGGLLIQRVPVGQLYDMDYWTKIQMKISNDSDTPRKYTLKVDKPPKVGVNVLKGYSSMPEPSWFWFEKNEVLVPANSMVGVKMFMRIPDEDKYCNQKWAIGIEIEGKSDGKETLLLSVSPVFHIETESRVDVKENPAGLFGLVPGIVVLENVGLTKNKKIGKIKIYNNDVQPHLYKISSIIPYAEPGRMVIIPSPDFSWIKDKKWLNPQIKTLKIGPQTKKDVFFDINIPKKQEFINQAWEGILFVETEYGLRNFVRVQIKTISQWR